MKLANKEFDCIEMKRQIQAEIYDATKDMAPDQLIEFMHQRVRNSRFSSILGPTSGAGIISDVS